MAGLKGFRIWIAGLIAPELAAESRELRARYEAECEWSGRIVETNRGMIEAQYNLGGALEAATQELAAARSELAVYRAVALENEGYLAAVAEVRAKNYLTSKNAKNAKEMVNGHGL